MGIVSTADLCSRYLEVRSLTEALAEPLSPEDQTVQSMPDVSPTKWHRAHTTWFFETFVLAPHHHGYRYHDPDYQFLFNSYYEAAGPRHARVDRGLLSRPGAAAVGAYRRAVDEAMTELLADLAGAPPDAGRAISDLVTLGLHHEQQHQELILMDIKHVLSVNPLRPAYRNDGPQVRHRPSPMGWAAHDGGIVEIGHRPEDGFAFDNEGPAHRVLLEPFELAHRLVTAGEWLEFMDDGGYATPSLWLSEGWHLCCERQWAAPAYGSNNDGRWDIFTLDGTRPVDPDEPVVHVSHFEADAFARWAGARLPLEAEWEVAASRCHRLPDALLDDPRTSPLHPVGDGQAPLDDLFGQVWQWTASPYVGYPGYRPPAGAIGEYNGKFMSNQMVLRGASWATPSGHARSSYRNFFPSSARWQFSGLRLARSARP